MQLLTEGDKLGSGSPGGGPLSGVPVRSAICFFVCTLPYISQVRIYIYIYCILLCYLLQLTCRSICSNRCLASISCRSCAWSSENWDWETCDGCCRLWRCTSSVDEALVDRTSERVVGVLMYPAPMKKRPCFFPFPALYTALASSGEFMTS